MANKRASPVNGAILPEGQPFKPGERAREIGRRGGRKSQENAKKRKTLKEDLLALLATEQNGKTVQEGINIALIKAALGGNTKAFEIIRDTIGEKPMEHVDLNIPDSDIMKEIRERMNGVDGA